MTVATITFLDISFHSLTLLFRVHVYVSASVLVCNTESKRVRACVCETERETERCCCNQNLCPPPSSSSSNQTIHKRPSIPHCDESREWYPRGTQPFPGHQSRLTVSGSSTTREHARATMHARTSA